MPDALRFVLRLWRPGDGSGRRRSIQRFGAAIDIYAPPGVDRGTIVFIHGMAAAGYRDPRVVDLCMALGEAGFRAVVPDIRSIRDLRIRRRQPDEVEALIRDIAADRELVPAGRFALMAVSFSGVFAVHAAVDERLAASLTGLCLVGAYSDLAVVCGFLIRARRADPYGLLLIARSYYTEVEPESEGFVAALERCIAGAVEHEAGWDPLAELDETDPEDARVAELLREPAARERFERDVRRAFNDGWRGYQVPTDFARRDIPVLLIHGRGDRVIPAGESRRLARRLAAQGIPHRLCITGLLTHGDSRLHWRHVREVCSLTRVLAWFFGACRRG